MRIFSQVILALLLTGCLIGAPALLAAQNPTTTPPPATQTTAATPGTQTPAPTTSPSDKQDKTTDPNAKQSQTTDPNAKTDSGGIPVTVPPPAPPPPDANSSATPAAKQPSGDQPVPQQSTVHPKNSKEDVDAIGNRSTGKGVNFYSLEKEIALGKALAQEVERTSKLIDDPIVTEYVNRVGQNLVRNSDARVPFTIKVIDSDEVNAFALPGGFFYVNSGLILRAQEEAELAGVMAHEISHVTARHGTKQATKGELMQIAAIAAMIVVPYGWAGYGIYEGMNLAIPLTFLKFSRDAEREADFLGIEYMYKAGYDPNAYITFFERIQADEKHRPGTVSKVFSTHPPTPDRIAATQKEIARILPEKEEYIVSTSEFDSVKARLRNVMFTRKAQDNAPGKPTMRTKTEQSDKNKQTTQGSDPNAPQDDDRPTLKRRPDDSP